MKLTTCRRLYKAVGRSFLFPALLASITVLADTKGAVAFSLFSPNQHSLMPSGANAPDGQSTQEILNRSEAAVGKTITNYKLVTQYGEQIQFRSLRGKILLLNFIYLDCPDMCILMSQSIQRFMDKVDPALEGHFTVLSISFDPRDNTPEKLKDYGYNFTDDFKNWLFVTTDEDTVKAMIEELGFSFRQQGEEFDHLNRLTLVDPDGKVLKHYYGTDFDAVEIEEAIKQTLAGNFVIKKFSAAMNSLVLFCSTYNQNTKTFEPDYWLLLSYLAQFLLVIATALWMIFYLWREPKKSE